MKKRREQYALIVAALIALPLVFAFARAFVDGQRRADETPLRLMFGDDTYEKLTRGERLAMHYLGDELVAPHFTLADERGQVHSLDEYRGKVVLLNLWTVSCRPCMQEMPTLDDLAQMVGGRGDIEVVTITTDASREAAEELHRTMYGAPMDWPENLLVLFDGENEVVRDKFGTRLFPETWIIDRDGVIRFRYDGARDWSDPLVLDVLESYL